ncbi:hypothetical protein KJ652_05215 [Patescibacteria group bacterium]|nr:hypothetical protein [Patescibacteria group bacterium]
MPKPDEIDFGFAHDDKKIWDLDIPTEVISIDELEHNLDIAYLDMEGTDDWNLTLREFINAPEKQPGHNAVVKRVDMQYPIEIYFFKGSWKILDGVHRYCRAVLEGMKTISVRKIPDSMIPKICKDSL